MTLLYAAQFKFNSDRLEAKANEVRVFLSLSDLIEASKKEQLREYDLNTEQDLPYKEEIAQHWIKKNNLEGQRKEELKKILVESSTVLPFPFIRVNEFKEGGKMGKLKSAMIINDHIYIVNGLDKTGIYNEIIRELE